MKRTKASINSILLDVTNPRFDPVTGQAEAVEELMNKCGAKIFSLAGDVVRFGVNPSDLPICKAFRSESGKLVYVAREGNRRLLAIKLLRKPSILKNAELTRRAKKLIRGFGGIGQCPSKLEILVFGEDETEAMNHWIKIKHEGENQGAGTVPWGTTEKERFRTGGKIQNLAIRIVDWLKSWNGLESADAELLSQVPITTLDRIVSSVVGRDMIGVTIQNGELVSMRDVAEARLILLKIIRDLTTPHPDKPRRKKINVNDVKNTEQIQGYLQRISAHAAPLSTPVVLSVDSGQHGSRQFNGNIGNPAPQGGVSESIGTPSFLKKQLRKIVSQNAKVQILVKELAALKISTSPLLFCLGFRSLLEISMLQYAHGNGIAIDNGNGKAVAYRDLVIKCKDKIVITPQWSNTIPRNAIKEAVATLNKDTLLSVTELNNLVHGVTQVSSVEIILTYAPRVIPFLIALNGGVYTEN